MSEDQTVAFKNVLCIRADNMGDLLMSTPALRALKETFGCKITVLTSAMGSLITPYIGEIDETIVADVPWVKTKESIDEIGFAKLIQTLAGRAFDAAIIFTVYSQNPLPAAMLAFLAGIPVRLAYCRENPYQLLTHWIPDEEPYQLIQHQVKRDLKLVASLDAYPSSKHLSVYYSNEAKSSVLLSLQTAGVDINQPFVIFHPGVSEDKRKYPVPLWIEAGKKCLRNGVEQIIITGSSSEESLCGELQNGIGNHCISTAGLFSVEELIAIIDLSRLLVSVNTGTVHIAAALMKPVVVLYALTNPQHSPWMTPSRILYYSVPESLRSQNQVVSHVTEQLMQKDLPYPTPEEVCEAVVSLLDQPQ